MGMALQRRLVDSGRTSLRSRAQQHRVEEQAKARGIRGSGEARTPVYTPHAIRVTQGPCKDIKAGSDMHTF